MRAVFSALGAGGLVLFAGPDLLVVAAVGAASFHVAHGATWPLLGAVACARPPHSTRDGARRRSAYAA